MKLITSKKVAICITLLLSHITISCDVDEKQVEEVAVQKPNIIYILADDLGYGDLSINGQTKFQTPNIDALANSGIRFLNHYSGAPVCAPSRSTLMTGLHTGHTPIRGNKEVKPEGQEPLKDEVVTTAELLKQAGYTTGAFGKWGLGFPGSSGAPENQGFDTFFGYNCQRYGHNYYPGHLWDNDSKIIIEENQGTKEDLYAPNLIHEKTLKFIEDNKGNPFFLYVPSIIPHAELFAPEKYIAKYRGKFDPEKEYEGCDEDCERYKNGGYGSQPESHAAFAAMVDLLDVQVGEIVAKVKALGLEDNTLIIFTSDNGPHLEGGADPDYFNSNGDFRGYKRDVYEGGMHVPMIANWPGEIKPKTETSHISAFWDVLPTFCDIAGVTIPENIDGLSFLPSMLGTNDQEIHDFLYWEFPAVDGRQAVRMGDWKGVRMNLFKGNKDIQLYNLSTDISEEHNVAEENPDVVNKIMQIMDREHVSSDIDRFKMEALGDVKGV